MTIDRSDFEGNIAQGGASDFDAGQAVGGALDLGGVFGSKNELETADVSNSTFVGNQAADGFGGTIPYEIFADGRGIAQLSGSLSLSNVNVVGNEARAVPAPPARTGTPPPPEESSPLTVRH